MAKRGVDADLMWTGVTIRNERESRGWSQAELAKRIGAITGKPDLTGSAVGQWESGKVNPTVPNLRAITAVFAPELLAGDPRPDHHELDVLVDQTRRRLDALDAKVDRILDLVEGLTAGPGGRKKSAAGRAASTRVEARRLLAERGVPEQAGPAGD